MAITTSQSKRCESETVLKHPVMPRDIFDAAMKGDRDVLIERLGLQTKEQTEIQEDGDPDHESTKKDLPFGPELMPLIQRTSSFSNKSNVTKQDSHSTPEKQTVRSELQSATRFGDTVLHLLITNKMHNELALMVFERDPSLLKTQNMMLETPLHCAAEVGNMEVIKMLIRMEPYVVKDALQETNQKGDTVLHILVSKFHNELALKVLERDPSLLKTQNKMLETPLHCAAEVRNVEFIKMLIQMEPSVVKDALKETNEKGDTAFHVALRYNFADICCNLMQLDSEVAYYVNKEMFSPVYIAIDEKRDLVAEQMLCVDPILACTKLTNGMFPVHFATRKHNSRMVLYFMKYFPDYAELVDYRGRNLYHLVAEETTNFDFFRELLYNCEDMTTRMNNATDYEGNTPLHIAAMKGHRHTMRFIWGIRMNCIAETIQNKRGLTPYEVSRNQLKEVRKDFEQINSRILSYEQINGEKFSDEWFMQVMVRPPPPPPPLPPLPRPSLENRWERTQVIGLGSVLITTVTFAAAFTIPGGYNQDHGTPVLETRYMFWAFILANTLSFIQGFLSLFALVIVALPGKSLVTFEFSVIFFLLAATSMVITFGLGLYVTLAPACLPIAIVVLILTLLIGSPALFFALVRDEYAKILNKFVYHRTSILAIYAFSLLFIFCLALLSL